MSTQHRSHHSKSPCSKRAHRMPTRIQGPCSEWLARDSMQTRRACGADPLNRSKACYRRDVGSSAVGVGAVGGDRSDDPDADEDPANGPSVAESASSSAKAGAEATPEGSAS